MSARSWVELGCAFGIVMSFGRQFAGKLAVGTLALAAGSVDLAAASRADKPLSGAAIKSLVTGTTVNMHTPVGSVVPVVYGKDGTLSGRATGFVAYYLGQAKDQGRWWIKGARLCHKWDVWFDQQVNCLAIRQKGTRFHWRNQKGKTGVATIVKANNVATLRSATRREKILRPPRALGAAVPANPIGPAPDVLPNPAPDQPSLIRATASAQTLPVRKPHPIAHAAKVTKTKTVQPSNAKTRFRKHRVAPTFRVAGVRHGDVLNVRDAPSSDGQIVGAIPANAKDVRIVGSCQSYWCPITHAHNTGWVSRAYLVAHASPEHRDTRWPHRVLFRVVGVPAYDVLNVRSKPDTMAPIINRLDRHAVGIRLTGRCFNGWCPIKFRGNRGWVNRAYIAPADISSALTR